MVAEDPRLHTLRTLLRGLATFRSFHESEGLSEIVDDNGMSWVLWDIEKVYECAVREPAKIGPFISLSSALKPGWRVRHTGVWMEIISVECLLARPENVVITLEGDRIKRRRKDAPIAALTPNRWQLMQQAKVEPVLPLRQRQAIEMYLVRNMPEEEVVALMGIKPNNPIRMYATSGLITLLKWMDEGRIPSPFVTGEEPVRVPIPAVSPEPAYLRQAS